MLTRLSLRLRVFLIFAGLAAAVIAATVVGLWLGYSRLGDPGAAQGFVQAGVLAGFAALGLLALGLLAVPTALLIRRRSALPGARGGTAAGSG